VTKDEMHDSVMTDYIDYSSITCINTKCAGMHVFKISFNFIFLKVILVNDMQEGRGGGACLILCPNRWVLIRAWALIQGNMVVEPP